MCVTAYRAENRRRIRGSHAPLRRSLSSRPRPRKRPSASPGSAHAPAWCPSSRGWRRPSPTVSIASCTAGPRRRGSPPFSDTWYLRQDRRMAQATLVWQLSRRLARVEATPAQRLIDVYESYCWLEAKPLLDIMRVAFVRHLVAVQEWQEQTCSQCKIQYLLPRDSVETPAGAAGAICATGVAIAARPSRSVPPADTGRSAAPADGRVTARSPGHGFETHRFPSAGTDRPHTASRGSKASGRAES